MQKYRAIAFAANVSVLSRGERIRVSLVLNYELPATVSWHDEQDATTLPYSMAQNLGLEEKSLGKIEQLTLAKEKLVLKAGSPHRARYASGSPSLRKPRCFSWSPSMKPWEED